MITSLVLLISLVPLLKAAPAVPESDNSLYPPTGLPANWTTKCDFRQSKPCKLFFNYLKDTASFSLSAEDANAAERSMASIRYITTGANVKGLARYGSKYIIPSPYSPVKAICISFRYRIIGDASLSLIEQPTGGAEHQFWADKAEKSKWHFHTSQITQKVPVKIIFNAQVNGGRVALADIMVYNYTCTTRDGDNFIPYTGMSRALTDAPYWPSNATIPYEIGQGFTVEQKAMIVRFFYDCTVKTCLRFVPRQNNEQSYMNFIKMDLGSGCSADLGNVGMTKITLDDDCFDEGYWQIAHMIMHGLGMRHEHVRTDRDNYIDVLTANIDPTKVAQFNKRTSGNQAVMNVGYDLKSVMHFFKDQYSIDGYSNSIQKKGDPYYELANRDGPTAMDYQKIAAIYCGGVTKSPTTPRPTVPTTTTTTTPRPAVATPCTTTSAIDRRAGIISNTQVNGYYRANENCGWLVTVTPGKAITLRFTMLYIEESEGCSKDLVTIYDGDSWETSPIIADLCGYNRPVENYTTSSNKMLVMFSTDSQVQYYGFSLAYNEIDITPEVGPAADAALSPADCNFEMSSCGWAQDTTTSLKFVRKTLPGLSNDHTTGTSSGTFLALDASSATGSNQYGVMKSSRIQWADGYACFSFWYRFVDPYQNIGKLQVWYATNTGNLIRLWSSDSPGNPAAYSQWVQVTINIFDIPDEYFRLILNGTIRSYGSTGGIAVDDIIMTQDDCSSINDLPPPIPEVTDEPYYPPQPEPEETTTIGPFIDGSNGYTCDFEASYCKWSNATSRADANWVRYSGRSTPGSTYGIQYDHTKQTQGAKYLLLNSLPNAKRTARIESSVAANSGYKCFELYYLMYGRHLGRLRIMARLYSGDELVLFEANGNKNAKWSLAQASLDGLTQAYTLIVEGYTTGQSDGDIGVDDFLLRTNDCYSEPLRVLAPTTTPYRTPNNPSFCDFEDGYFCGKSLQFTGDLSATRQFANTPGGTATQAAGGPLVDHSQGLAKGRFAAVRSGYVGDTAVLKSKSFGVGDITCMNFWYWMSPNDAGQIKVSYIDQYTNVEKPLYTIDSTNRLTNAWTNPQFSIPRTSGDFILKFTAISGGLRSYIAIDDVSVSLTPAQKCVTLSRSMGGMTSRNMGGRTRSLMGPVEDQPADSEQPSSPDYQTSSGLSRRRRQATSSLIACRFANNDFCDWSSNGKWQAVTTSAQVDTSGPDDRFAHVTSGRLVVSANNARAMGGPSAAMTSNLTGILTSQPVFVASYRASQSCFRFWYKISGWFRDLPMDVLNVYVRPANNANSRRLIATLSGSMTPPSDSLDEWVDERLTVFESQNYQMVFEATTGDSWIGTIAIDDIQLTPQLCPTAFPQ